MFPSISNVLKLLWFNVYLCYQMHFYFRTNAGECVSMSPGEDRFKYNTWKASSCDASNHHLVFCKYTLHLKEFGRNQTQNGYHFYHCLNMLQ